MTMVEDRYDFYLDRGCNAFEKFVESSLVVSDNQKTSKLCNVYIFFL